MTCLFLNAILSLEIKTNRKEVVKMEIMYTIFITLFIGAIYLTDKLQKKGSN